MGVNFPLSDLLPFLRAQIFVTPPTTPLNSKTSLESQTVIITGANTGLGLDAARHVLRLRCPHLIIACRSTSKGDVARRQLITDAKSHGATPNVEVWPLDLSSWDSMKAFISRCEALPRIDCVLHNAGMEAPQFSTIDGVETVTFVNVVGTMYLGLQMLPIMRENAARLHKDTKLLFTGSGVHMFGTPSVLTSAKEGHMLEAFTERWRENMRGCYVNSKMMETLAVQEMAKLEPVDGKEGAGRVIISHINPGWCRTELPRNMPQALFQKVLIRIIGRSSEQGSRTLSHAIAQAGREAHGQYLSECQVKKGGYFVRTPSESAETQRMFWNELVDRYETVAPGSRSILQKR